MYNKPSSISLVTMPSTPRVIKKELRKHMREQRHGLPQTIHQMSSKKLALRLKRMAAYKKAKNIAFYLPSDGEISLQFLIDLTWLSHKKCYLPVIKSKNKMEFARFSRGDKLVCNKYNIREPQKKSVRIPVKNLDLILLPLVAFDSKCHRLGMGGGYYDRILHFKRKFNRRNKHMKPILIGVAYDFQRCETIPTERWDIAVNHIVTDQKTYGTI